MSVDSLASHREFAASQRLNFPLISDPAPHPIATAYGTLMTRGDTSFTSRSTFVIGADGTIAAVFPEVKIDGHVAEVLAAIGALKR